MRKGLDKRGMNREHGIKQVGKPYPMRLRDEAETRAVTIEAPRSSLFDNVDARFIVPIQQFIRHFSQRIFVCQFQSFRPEPLGTDNSHETIRKDAANGSIRL